jgi:hypothetical protein
MLTATSGKEKGSDCGAAFRVRPITGQVGFSEFLFRNSISRFNADTTNWPVLSFGSLSISISSAMSCGTRAAIVCDFRLIALVAIVDSFLQKSSTVWQKK